jgi:hypothetical protein
MLRKPLRPIDRSRLNNKRSVLAPPWIVACLDQHDSVALVGMGLTLVHMTSNVPLGARVCKICSQAIGFPCPIGCYPRAEIVAVSARIAGAWRNKTRGKKSASMSSTRPDRVCCSCGGVVKRPSATLCISEGVLIILHRIRQTANLISSYCSAWSRIHHFGVAYGHSVGLIACGNREAAPLAMTTPGC